MLSKVNKFDRSNVGKDNGRPMEVRLAFVADAANDTEGKLNVLGIFDQIAPIEYPYLHPSMCVVVSFVAHAAEFGRKKDFEVALMDPDGRALTTLKATGTVPRPEAGKKAHLQMVLRLINTPFPKPGPYEFVILVGGDQKGQIPLEVLPPVKQRRARKKANGS